MSNKKAPHNKLLISTFLFVLSILILLFLFPRETKFKFEFSKGKPWQHERLIAPFSFAINKTDEQLIGEEDSIRKNNTPYFIWNKNIEVEKREALVKSFIAKDSLSTLFADSLLKIAYQKYIIDPIILERLKQHEIFVIKDNNSYLIPIQDIYTPKKLFLELQTSIKNYLKRHQKNDQITNLFEHINIENYLSKNITFSQDLTEKFLNQKLSRVSMTTGLVQKGELIISTGEIISNTDYEILRSYRSEYEKRYSNSGSFILIIGNLFIISSPFALLFLFLFQYRKKILLDVKKIIFILSNILIFIVLTLMIIQYKSSYIYLLPIIILPVIIRAFLDTRVANFIFITTLLLAAYLTPNGYQFIFIQFIGGTIALFSLSHIIQRSHIFKTSLIVFLSYSITYIGMSMIQEGNWSKIAWSYLIYFAANALMITLSYPLIYISEKIFGFTSDVTLLELSDTNHVLLKRLSEKAPGTFQHSLQVANIAEELIRHIGGNPLLVRIGALYHDIGKLKNPAYFTENQSENFSPHQKLSCLESAKIIIRHIPDGLELAKKHKLPQAVINFIPMHQGTLTVKFFLTTYKQKHPNESIDEAAFTYPGPKPFSKETAVVMIADSIEAASRSLKNYTPETIENLVNKIIDYQLEQKQFENVNMTFKDLNTIKQVLKEKLATIYHSRIEYPEEEPLVKK